MNQNFTSDFFSGNRKSLKSNIDNDFPVVITANGLIQRAGDSAFPFRQDSNFWYLTGIQQPEMVLVMAGSEEFLILPERNEILDVFDGAINHDQLRSLSGIQNIYNQHDGWEKLAQLVKQHTVVNVPLHKAYDEHHNIYLNPAKARLVRQLKKLDVEVHDIRRALARLRMIKQPVELDAIQRAIDITIDSFEAIFAKNWYARHPSEAVIDAMLSFEFAKRGSTVAYPSIVAGGGRACTLHYVENNQTLAKDELLLIDAGAEWNNYAADITRVFSPNAMSQKQKIVYQAVKDAQSYAVSLIKPGVDIRTVQKKTANHIGRFLKSQKLITKLDPHQISKYYPHAISHHLGLDVHDAADYSLRLAEGMVLTVEPGIYIPEWSVGIRIEDDVVVTKTGTKVMSDRLPS